MMAVNEFGQVPPPSSLQGTSAGQSQELTADQLLDIAIQQAAFMQSRQTLFRRTLSGKLQNLVWFPQVMEACM